MAGWQSRVGFGQRLRGVDRQGGSGPKTPQKRITVGSWGVLLGSGLLGLRSHGSELAGFSTGIAEGLRLKGPPTALAESPNSVHKVEGG